MKSLCNFLPFCAFALLAASPALRAEDGTTASLHTSIYAISAEIADRFDTRQHGLMQRTHMEPHEGMLFVFDRPGRQCMWMKNTLIPLAVAFLDDEGIIVNIEEMEPQTLNEHCAARPVRYALEMNGGWFAARGLGVGTVIKGVAGRLAVN